MVNRTSKSGSSRPSPESRRQAVLAAIIHEHLRTGDAIGSHTVAEKFAHAVGWSSATIRNVMAELDEFGLLEQPHTSAGRIPTDRGYRYYVDNIISGTRLSKSDLKAIEDIGTVERMTARPDRLMERASDKYFSRLGWMPRAHPIELPTRRIIVPLYSDGYSFSLMAISDDGGLHVIMAVYQHGFCVRPRAVPLSQHQRVRAFRHGDEFREQANRAHPGRNPFRGPAHVVLKGHIRADAWNPEQFEEFALEAFPILSRIVVGCGHHTSFSKIVLELTQLPVQLTTENTEFTEKSRDHSEKQFSVTSVFLLCALCPVPCNQPLVRFVVLPEPIHPEVPPSGTNKVAG